MPAKIDKAFAYHKKGLLAEAKEIYLDILKTHPKHFQALHLLGVIAEQKKNSQLAVELIGEAIEVNPGVAEAHYNLGNALGTLGNRDEADVCRRRSDGCLFCRLGPLSAHHSSGNKLDVSCWRVQQGRGGVWFPVKQSILSC